MRRAYNICGPVSSLVPEYKRSLEGLDVVGAYRPTFALHPIDRTHILGVGIVKNVLYSKRGKSKTLLPNC